METSTQLDDGGDFLNSMKQSLTSNDGGAVLDILRHSFMLEDDDADLDDETQGTMPSEWAKVRGTLNHINRWTSSTKSTKNTDCQR